MTSDVDVAYVPILCDILINQAVIDKNNWKAHELYGQMSLITGVIAKNATYEDFQRKFYCDNRFNDVCMSKGLQFPRSCSHPPCDRCTVSNQSKLNKTLSEISKQCYCFI